MTSHGSARPRPGSRHSRQSFRLHLSGRVAQWESTVFTRRGSLVQSQPRPPSPGRTAGPQFVVCREPTTRTLSAGAVRFGAVREAGPEHAARVPANARPRRSASYSRLFDWPRVAGARARIRAPRHPSRRASRCGIAPPADTSCTGASPDNDACRARRATRGTRPATPYSAQSHSRPSSESRS